MHEPSKLKPANAPAYWARDAIVPGIVAIGPMLPGTLAFGMAFGAMCAQKQFSLAEVLVMMGTVYGGLSQFVAVQSWPAALTPAAIATLALLTLTVNIRFFLMSATLRPWFGTLPAWQSYPAMLLVTDGGWLAAMRYREHGGANAAFYAAGGIVLYVLWLVSPIPGYLFAERLADPKQFGVDLVMPAFYAALLVPAWKGVRRAIPWAVLGRRRGGDALAGRRLVVHHRRRARGRRDRRRAAGGPRGRKGARAMMPAMRGDVLMAFAVMTAVTVASRLCGYWLMGYVTVTPRVRRMLDALPGSIIVAAALPVAINGGAVVIVAIAAALSVAILLRNDFIAVITGMAVAALARALGMPG